MAEGEDIEQTIGQAAEQEAEGEDIDQTIGQAAEQEGRR